MAKAYYTLIVRDFDRVWRPEFGDYDYQVVKDELEEYREQGTIARRDLKIVTTDGKQSSIDAAVAKLNGKS